MATITDRVLQQADTAFKIRKPSIPQVARRGVMAGIFLLSDACALVCGWLLMYRVFPVSIASLGFPVFFLSLLLFVSAAMILGGYAGPYERRPECELELACKAGLVFLCLPVLLQQLRQPLPISGVVFPMVFGMIVLSLVATFRFLARFLYLSWWRRGWGRLAAVFVGSADSFLAYRACLSIQRQNAIELIGFLSPSPIVGKPGDDACLGGAAQWFDVLLQRRCHIFVVCDDAREQAQEVENLARQCATFGVRTVYWRNPLGPQGSDRPFPARSALEHAMKRAMDIFAGAVGSIVALLMWPVVSALIRREDRGPAFHSREFVNNEGKIEYYLKFRSMLQNADAVLKSNPELWAEFQKSFKLVNDPRVLKVGRILRKYSLDEFPQFFSVLRGQLSLVGPRVICGEETGHYAELLPKLLSVKPGLTGYWQVMGRRTTTYTEKVQMDMFYVSNWSIWLDILIAFKTIWKVMRAEGAY